MKQYIRASGRALVIAGYLAAGFALVGGISPAAAQFSASRQPIEISATRDLVWDRKSKTYTAHGDVTVTQQGSSLHSDTLTAYYQGAKGAGDIERFEAQGSVVITADPYTARGEKAEYIVKEERARLTGGALEIVAQNQKLTARDRIEYFGHDNRVEAVGEATAYKDGNSLTAPTLVGYFAADAQGKKELRKVTAQGGVVIRTARETVYGDEGVYDIATQKAVLTGTVKIYQGQSWLQGTRADVDMRSGVSRLTAEGDAASGGRVKGVFYPSSQGK